jgi:hypothetical protein
MGSLGTSTPRWARADPLGHPLRNHDNSGMGIGPRHMGQDGAIHHPQSLDAMHATILIHHSHRVCGWPHLAGAGDVASRAHGLEQSGVQRLVRG